MQIKELRVRIKESYESNAGTYEAKVKIADAETTLELALSSATICKIFACIREDAAACAMRAASATPQACLEAEHTPLLIEQSTL